jgi:hypothetical protein
MISALVYLQFHSFKNRLLKRLERLKQPKYLLGAIAGGIYFYFFFFRHMFRGVARPNTLLPATSFQNLALYESIGALILLVIVFLAWFVPHQRAALTFTEAEVAFLFPAPISRRGLIHYKLLRSQTAILFTTLLLSLFSNRYGGRFWGHAIGWWLILSTLNLHFLGSSFARTMLLERGISNWQRRLAILMLVLIVAGVVLVWGWRTMPAFSLSQIEDFEGFKDYFTRALTSGPAPYLLYPFRLVVRPYLAMDAQAFALATVPALALMLVHYGWVIRANVAFEEASVEASRKLADKVAAVRAGNWRGSGRKPKSKRAPFTLKPTGQPAIALLWKNLISAGQVFTLRLWLVLAATTAGTSVGLGQAFGGAGWTQALGLVAVMLLFWSLFLGPQFLRQDFRQDLPQADLLKMYPLRGWEVVLGELFAPVAILTGLQWFLLILGAGLMVNVQEYLAANVAWGAALGAGLILPMLNAILLLIPNAAVLLFPAWFQASREGAHGIEATGQRLIFVLGQFLVFLVALLPAALFSAGVFFLLKLFVSVGLAVPLASLVAALVLAAEAALGLIWLGWVFERFDLSLEQSP